jgi:hypothetical protein
MPSTTELAWDECPDEDFDYFTVYGSENPGLDETAVLIGYTTGTTLDVSMHSYGYYHVTATDYSGNEGDAASVENTGAGANGLTGIPSSYALMQNRPNPFKTGTVVRFDLPRSEKVLLEVYDVTGRLVKSLVSGTYRPGRHSVIWAGDGVSGVPVGPGIYFLSIEAGDFSDVKKMMVVR